MSEYLRDLVGYGANPPQVDWPGSARLAVQCVLNYDEGGENSILHGDNDIQISHIMRCAGPSAR
jgi:hypothetical protein